MSAYDLFECFEIFICEKIFLKQWLEQKKTGYPPKLHLCYPKTKACIDMKIITCKGKQIIHAYSTLIYSLILLKKKIPSGVATVRTRVFHDASVLVGGDLKDVDGNQSRQFVLLNKQKFV